MANFKNMPNEDKNKYLVEGELTDNDIDFINSFDKKTILVFKNTCGLSSYLISKITNNNVFFCVTGGYNSILESDRLDKDTYRNRTYLSHLGLATILYYFETIENELDQSWTDVQKAMYIYSVLASEIQYVKELDENGLIKENVLPRSLNGILYNKLTCAGFSLVFKEMMDRQGIKCFFQNKTGSHDFNVIELEGNLYGIDLTWDNCFDKNTSVCEFKQFGRDTSFYNNIHHRNGCFVREEDLKDIDLNEWTSEIAQWQFTSKKREGEYNCFVPYVTDKIFDLSFFSEDEFQSNLSVIKDKLEKRKKCRIDLNLDNVETKKLFLPYGINAEGEKERIEKEKDTIIKRFKGSWENDCEIFSMINFLKQYGYVDRVLYSFLDEIKKVKHPYLLDLINEFSINPNVFYLDEYSNVTFFSDGTFSNNEINDNVDHNKYRLSDEKFNMIKDIIILKVNEYCKKFIDEIIDELPFMLNSYKQFENSKEKYDLYTVVELASKLKVLLGDAEVLIKYNYRSDELKKSIQIVTNFLTINEPYNESMQKENDIEFLYEAFSDIEAIKTAIEEFECRVVNEDEFYNMYINVDYMMNVFDKLKEYSLNKEELSNLLNSILEDKKTNTIH